MMFPNQPIYVYFLFPIKAKWFVLIFGGIALWAGVTVRRPGSHTSRTSAACSSAS
jgi:hypothetical protein